MKKTIIFTAAMVSVLANACIGFAELRKITDNVYSYLDAKDPSAANAFGANAGFVEGRDGIAVIDTLVSAKTAIKMIEDIRKITDKKIQYVVNTHYHLDHAFGNSEFKKLGAIIIATENCRNNIIKTAPIALKSAGNYGLAEQDLEGTEIVVPSVAFDSRMTIDVGDDTIELITFGPSHSSGSCLVYLPSKKILFAGDILFTDFHPFMGESDISGWLRVLDYILWLDVEKIIPGHGPLSTKKDIAEMKEYLATFDTHAKRLAAKSQDPKLIETELLKLLPQRSRGGFLIPANIQLKYLTQK